MSTDHLTLLIFVITYVGIALGRVPGLLIDRTGIALVGAIALVGVGAITVEHAVAAIDFSTILLLFGLMILSAQLRVAGFYRLVARLVLRGACRPLVLLSGMIVASATLSSLFANDIVCLAFTPVVCEVVRTAGGNPTPYLIALATSSNIGSVATLIGNPQNMFVGQVAGLDFAHYASVMIPVAVCGIVVNIVVIIVVWPREFRRHPTPLALIDHPAELATLIPDYYLIVKTLLLSGLLLIVFVLGWRRDVCALTAAALLLCSRRTPAAHLYSLVDWNLIMLFVALFVVIGALQQRGLMRWALDWISTGGLELRTPGALVGVSTVLSNLVSNVPAVLLLRDVPGTSRRLWYLLAMSSTLAGNMTLLGSIANLIVIEKAAVHDIRVGFMAYLGIGIPLTLIMLVIGTFWVVSMTAQTP
jgi:Na+/H+ antiporter NhaD/arsenite permease-like protein